ncbi:MAG: AMP-binding protein [Chloroflexota bacterium]
MAIAVDTAIAATVDTLPKLLRAQYQKYGDKKVAMRKKEFGIWNEYTWKDSYQHVRRVSLGLVSIGLKPGDVVAIVGDSDPQWFWAEYATQAAGGIAVGMYVDAHFTEIKYLLSHSEAKFVFAKDQEQVDKVLEVKGDLPALQKVIYWEAKGLWYYDLPFLMSWEELEGLGKKYDEEHPAAFDENIDRTKPDDIAVLCYTSGTTRATEDGIAKQKGVMLSHGFLITNASAWHEVDPWFDNDVWLSFVPPAWGAEQITGIAGCLLSGTEVNFPEEPETVTENIREVGPQILFMGARLWENYASLTQSKNNDTTRLKRWLFNTFLRVGYRRADLKFQGKRPSIIERGLFSIADWLVFRPLRDKLGMLRLRSGFQAGSSLSADTLKFFHAIGVNLKQLYGLTEGGVFCFHTDDDIDPETVGRPIHMDWVRISPQGEILLTGPLRSKGYYKDPEATRELIDSEGWLHTGDSGHINEKGHLVFYDRIKEMVELSSGRKFAPSYIEGKLRFSPYVKDVMVMGGPDKPFVSAMVNIDFENVSDWAEEHRINYTTFVDLSQKEQVYDLILKDMERVNRYLPDEMKVRKFVNLHKEFDPDEAELTRSRKLRRKFVENRYADVIGAIYGGKEGFDIEAPVKYRDGRTGIIKTTIRVKSVV